MARAARALTASIARRSLQRPSTWHGQRMAGRQSALLVMRVAAPAAGGQGAELRRPVRAHASARWFGRHRVALDNLRQAYPEKAEAEIEEIASDMWGNMARLAGEYIFLDQLFDFDPETKHGGRIEVDGEPLFPAHRAEADAAHHLHRASRQFRTAAGRRRCLRHEGDGAVPPAEQPVHRRLHLSTRAADRWATCWRRARARPSRSPASWKPAAISACWSTRNSSTACRTTFFGRACETNPLLPKLARHFDCDVYPARCIRLPGNRFRLCMEEKLELPRNDDGASTSRTAQLLNDIVERWVREDPASGCGSTSAGSSAATRSQRGRKSLACCMLRRKRPSRGLQSTRYASGMRGTGHRCERCDSRCSARASDALAATE